MADYHIYYMSFTTCEYSGGTCVYGAQAVYDKPGANGSCTSNSSAGVTAAKSGLLTAVYEARAPFESFQPMEMPMTAGELEAWLGARADSPLVVVLETRERQVKMRRQLRENTLTLQPTPTTISSDDF